MCLRVFLFVLLMIPVVVVAQEVVDMREVMKLQLIESDLLAASRIMAVYDRDDSGALDESERRILSWKYGAVDFDVNRDGLLTNVEVALREAHLRFVDDIIEKDVKAAGAFLKRNDRNRNGRLDPGEVGKIKWSSPIEEFDANGDGIVTSRELETQFAFTRRLYREFGIEAVDESRAKMVMLRFDVDKDGKLGNEEFKAAPISALLSKFDQNKDSTLDGLELATLYASHRMEMGLSHFDVKKIIGIFAKHDSDGDGAIELGLSKKLIESEFGKGVSVDFGKGNSSVQQLIHFDADKDGVVTISEVENHLAKIREKLGYGRAEYQKAGKIISRYDRDRSNHIEPPELGPAIEAKQLPASSFSTIDRNEDGKIALVELARHFWINKGDGDE